MPLQQPPARTPPAAASRHSHLHSLFAAANPRLSWPSKRIPRPAAASSRSSEPGPLPPPPPPQQQLAESMHSNHHGQPIVYGGLCTSCSGRHELHATPEAVAAAHLLVDRIEAAGRLDFESTTPDPRFSLQMLTTAGPGRMLGVLTAVHPHAAASGSSSVVTLKAFSGQITESWHIPGWAGPVAGVTSASAPYVQARAEIEALSAQLQALEVEQREEAASEQQQQQRSRRRQQRHNAAAADGFAAEQLVLLKQRRKALSHALLQQVQESYASRDMRGRPLLLLAVYQAYVAQHDRSLPLTRAGGFTGMPAGVGDCCAPKLLHAAAAAGLRPTGLAEIWCGSGPGTATPAKAGRPLPDHLSDAASSRRHRQLYGMCPKCEAVLGSMLCGLG